MLDIIKNSRIASFKSPYQKDIVTKTYNYCNENNKRYSSIDKNQTKKISRTNTFRLKDSKYNNYNSSVYTGDNNHNGSARNPCCNARKDKNMKESKKLFESQADKLIFHEEGLDRDRFSSISCTSNAFVFNTANNT